MTAAKKEPETRLNPLTEQMVKVYEEFHHTKYNHSGAKDAMALKGLLAKYEPEVILSVWAKGVTASGFEQVFNFAQLSGKWSQLVAVKNDPRASNVYKQPQKRPEGVCARCGGAPYGVSWRVALCLECWADWYRDSPADTSEPPFPPGHLESQCAKYETWTREWASKGRP